VLSHLTIQGTPRNAFVRTVWTMKSGLPICAAIGAPAAKNLIAEKFPFAERCFHAVMNAIAS
jgi:hypothetical protein